MRDIRKKLLSTKRAEIKNNLNSAFKITGVGIGNRRLDCNNIVRRGLTHIFYLYHGLCFKSLVINLKERSFFREKISKIDKANTNNPREFWNHINNLELQEKYPRLLK